MIFGIIFSSFATTPDIPKTTTTASCADAILNTNGGTANIEINWEPNTIPLHWYDGNTELTVPTESQSCVYGGSLTPPPPPPARTGYTFRGWRVKSKTLPEGYTRLQYIESNGTQVINTGIGFDTSRGGLKTAVKLQLTTTNTSERAIWGPKDYCAVYEVYFSGGKQVGFYRASGQSVSVPVNYTPGVPYTITTKMTSNSMTINVNGVQRQYSGDVSAISDNITLFGMCGNYRISARVYYADMWKNNTLVRRFIPAKRNSDNAVGMWDMVSQTFFPSATNENFIAGPNAQ